MSGAGAQRAPRKATRSTYLAPAPRACNLPSHPPRRPAMSFIRAALACLLLLVASAAQAQAPSKVALDEVDRIFAAWQGQAPGLVYGVVADGALVHVAGLGVQDMATRRPVTAESLFRIASM